MRLRGREHQHRDRATDLLNRVVEDLNTAGKVQSFDHRALTLFLSPSEPVGTPDDQRKAGVNRPLLLC